MDANSPITGISELVLRVADIEVMRKGMSWNSSPTIPSPRAEPCPGSVVCSPEYSNDCQRPPAGSRQRARIPGRSHARSVIVLQGAGFPGRHIPGIRDDRSSRIEVSSPSRSTRASYGRNSWRPPRGVVGDPQRQSGGPGAPSSRREGDPDRAVADGMGAGPRLARQSRSSPSSSSCRRSGALNRRRIT